MANRFIGGVQSSRPQTTIPFISRASIGTYFDSTGVLRTAPANQPRLNYSYVNGTWAQPALLIEPASTNLRTTSIPSSVDAGGSVTVNSTTAPDGTTTATKFTEDSASSTHRFYLSGLTDTA
jgi:hypothetical protein